MRTMGMSMAVVVVAVLAGCGGSAPTKPTGGSTGGAPAASAALPSGFILTAAPAAPQDVGAAKKEVKNGDEVVIRGRVGGREKDVFTPGYASFLLADMSLKACNEKGDDGCKTPWDYCCDDADHINANMVNVEVRGANGKPLKVELKGVEKIDHLSTLVVKGKAVKKENDPNVTIVADGIYVEKAAQKL